jgi:hypothetical protein
MRSLRRRTRRGRAREAPAASLGPRIALWGVYDVADYARLLVPRILERELRLRLPLARVDHYSPLGFEHPIPMDGGRPALPLGAGSARRRRDLAERHDLVVVTGDVIHTRDTHYAELYGDAVDSARLRPSDFFVDGLGPDLEDHCPVVWSAVGVPYEPAEEDWARLRSALARRAHVSARDRTSRKRLENLGAHRDIALVPDATALAARAFHPDVLRKRLDYLRVLGCYPTDGRPVVVDGDAVDAEAAAELADEIVGSFPTMPIVIVRLRRPSASTALAEEIASRSRDVCQLPVHATLEDITAAIAAARTFVSTPEHRPLAASFDVPLAVPTGAEVELAAEPDLAEETEARVGAELDTLAEIAERSWSESFERGARTPEELLQALVASEERHVALLSAYEARGERLVSERMRFAEIVERLDESGGTIPPDAALRIAELENAIFTAQAVEAEARFEIKRLHGDRGLSG